MIISEALVRIKALIGGDRCLKSQHNGTESVDADGRYISANSPRARKWTVAGAVQREIPDCFQSAVMGLLMTAHLRTQTGPSGCSSPEAISALAVELRDAVIDGAIDEAKEIERIADEAARHGYGLADRCARDHWAERD